MELQPINPAKAYLDAIMLAAFGVNVIGGVVVEWQLDEVKECALKLKEAEIDHMSLPEQDKDGLKLQWKQWFEAYVQGFKDVLRNEGRLV